MHSYLTEPQSATLGLTPAQEILLVTGIKENSSKIAKGERMSEECSDAPYVTVIYSFPLED